MNPAKLVVAILWVLGIGAFFAPDSATGAILGRRLFWFLAIAHTVECALFLPVLRKAPGGLGGHLLQTFVFGLFHVREVRAAQAE